MFYAKCLFVSLFSHMERISYRYRGESLKGRKIVSFLTNDYLDMAKERSIALSIIEASLSGYDIALIDRGRIISLAENLLLQTGGRLYVFSENFSQRKNEERLYLTGGGLIVPDDMSGTFFMLSASSFVLITELKNSELSFIADNQIDSALLRPALRNERGERAHQEGMVLADSFSSLFHFPRIVAYESSSGNITSPSFRFDYHRFKC